MNASALEEFGLTKNESKVYFALLRLGSANSATLAQEAGVHRINVYDVLNSLVAKGVVSYMLEGKVRMFRCENPQRFRQILEEKTAAIDSILPLLLKEFEGKRSGDEVTLLRGPNAKKAQFEEIIGRLKNGGKIYVYMPSAYSFIERRPFAMNLEKWYAQYKKHGIKAFIMLPDTKQARLRASKYKKFRGTVNYSFFNGLKFSPVTWNVAADLVFITIFTDPYFIIRIKSREIAESFKNNFEMLLKFGA
ncbi:MAG TPA: helix-turn-helix domain-containing protein [archaeon]|nr:helix-turn-helix domain-containing protein [archaeon]